MDKLEIIEDFEDEEEGFKKEQPNIGLGLKEMTRNTRSNSSQTKQQRSFTPAPLSRSPIIIIQEALNVFAYGAMSNPPLLSTARTDIPPPSYDPIDLENFCAPLLHPTTGKIISKYKEPANNSETSEVWRTVFGKEFGGLAQGDNKTGKKGGNAIIVLDHEGINNIPVDRNMT